MSDTALPTVTVAIPALNEEHFIDAVLESFSTSAYPRIKEILVADGGSTDRTIEKVGEWSRRDPRIRLIRNPERIQAAALNLMLQEASGEFFLRADAHSLYAPDYVERSVEAAVTSGAFNTGGAQRYVARTRTQAAIALAMYSRLGTGGASYKNAAYTGFADTVYLGCYRTDILKLEGGFNTTLHPNEDAELNLRLRKRSENAVFIDASIKAFYFPRATLKDLCKQYFFYGRGRAATMGVHFPRIEFRGALPFLVFASWLLLVGLSAARIMSVLIPGLISGLYLGAVVFEAFRLTLFRWPAVSVQTWSNAVEAPPSSWALLLPVAAAILLAPVSHAVGFGVRILRLPRKS